MISERLKEVREALGVSQQAMANRLDVSLRSQQNYEAGSRTPDAMYLAALAAIGVDVLYIVTGQRNEAMPAVDASEQALLESYRRCKPEARVHLIQTAALLSAGLDMPAPKPKNKISKAAGNVQIGDMVSTHDGAVQIGYAGGKVRVSKK